MGLLDRVLREGLSGLWHTYAGSASCWVGVILVQHGPGLAGSPVPRLLTVTLDEHLSSLLF